MTPKRKQRLIFVMVLIVGFGAAIGLALFAFQKNLLYFYSPSQIASSEVEKGQMFRLGGLVVEGSVVRESDGITTQFDLTDTAGSITVRYTGLLPDLFREGQGIVAQGKINQKGVFVAQEVLAKHDENYMPPEVAEALKEAGAKHPVSIPKTTIN
ncbi:MAG: cytochrome c maturation protein CcmE [Gammaproteobacteria bacterium]|nr:cytochrome c maturation protein CcmE [Gammaproteobacteria bacterium]